jgi:hypothetical protein
MLSLFYCLVDAHSWAYAVRCSLIAYAHVSNLLLAHTLQQRGPKTKRAHHHLEAAAAATAAATAVPYDEYERKNSFWLCNKY